MSNPSLNEHSEEKLVDLDCQLTYRREKRRNKSDRIKTELEVEREKDWRYRCVPGTTLVEWG